MTLSLSGTHQARASRKGWVTGGSLGPEIVQSPAPGRGGPATRGVCPVLVESVLVESILAESVVRICRQTPEFPLLQESRNLVRSDIFFAELFQFSSVSLFTRSVRCQRAIVSYGG